MKSIASTSTFLFRDPRLHMTALGRMAVRTLGYIAEVVTLVAAIDFMISDIAWIRYIGIFLVLFIIDRALHFGEADRPLAELVQGMNEVNLAPYLTPKAFSALERAHDRAVIADDDFFLALARELIAHPGAEEGLRRLDIEPKEFKARIEEFMEGERREAAGDKRPSFAEASAGKQVTSKHGDAKTDEALTALVTRAYELAKTGGHRFIEVSDLFSALPDAQGSAIERLMNVFKITSHDLRASFLFTSAIARRQGALRHHNSRTLRHRAMNRAWTARPTPMLDSVSDDLTDLARNGSIGFLVGHEAEYERLTLALARPTEPNALLVGDAGIGKGVLAERLAYDITKDRVPASLFDKRLVELHLSSLVAGADAGVMQKRLATIVHEIVIAGNVILYIPDIHELVRTSGTAYLSAADALLPIIASNAFPIIGATYPREFKECIEPRSDFFGRFEKIIVEEVTVEEAELILTYDAVALEAETKVAVSFGAIKGAVALGRKYFHAKPLPSCASNLLKDAVAHAVQRGEKMVGASNIVKTAEGKTNVPVHEADEAEADSLLHLEEIIHKKLIGQDEAVTAVANALREYRSGLARVGGPVASFLFVGPTGVGKTELAKALARIQFGDADALVRFDMTEYQDAGSVHRFIGSTDGSTQGSLTDAIREKPYAVVLLDEFEKAHSDILNLFLQLLDDARLTDAFGRTVNFENTIIIATSNAHSDIINGALAEGKSMSDVEDVLKKRLVDVFRPELLNRFSKVVVFKSLRKEDVMKVAELNLAELARTLHEQGIEFSTSPEAVRRVAELGFDPEFGARPLRRVIEERVRALLAEKILKKELVRGSSVMLEVQGENLQLTTYN